MPITEETALTIAPNGLELERQRFMPVMSLQIAAERRQAIKEAIGKLMEEGQDFGVIPGTRTEPTLLQPGAQKLDNLFGLVPRFEVIDKEEDWTGKNHNGEPFFRYLTRCVLYRGDFVMGEGIGECNSWEAKYRWRKAERKCPNCGLENIRKSKQAEEWYCWQKLGGCGAKFDIADERITKQEVGRIPNPDIFDQVNTIVKISAKRSHIFGTINSTSASEFFTQDLEDRAGEPTDVAPEEWQAATVPHRTNNQPAAPRAETVTRQEGTRPASSEPDPFHEPAGKDAPSLLNQKPPGGSHKKPFNMADSVASFDKMKLLMNQRLGDKVANEIFYRVLGAHGAEDPKDLKDASSARACFNDLCYQADAALIAAKNQQASANAFDAHMAGQ